MSNKSTIYKAEDLKTLYSFLKKYLKIKKTIIKYLKIFLCIIIVMNTTTTTTNNNNNNNVVKNVLSVVLKKVFKDFKKVLQKYFKIFLYIIIVNNKII